MDFPREMKQASREYLFYSHIQMQVQSDACSNKHLNHDRWWLTAHRNTVFKCKRDSTGTHALQSKHCCLQQPCRVKKIYRHSTQFSECIYKLKATVVERRVVFTCQLSFFYENSFMYIATLADQTGFHSDTVAH